MNFVKRQSILKLSKKTLFTVTQIFINLVGVKTKSGIYTTPNTI